MAPETPKSVSSRLLTMKFMQRAVASSASSPASDSDAHSAKKRKLGHKPSDNEFLAIDQAAIKAAIDDREAKRQAALQRHAGNDTHWVLETALSKKKATEKSKSRGVRVVYVGYGDIDADKDDKDDSDEEQEDDAVKVGRTSTRKSQKSEKAKSKRRKSSGSEGGAQDMTENSDSSDSEGESESDADTSQRRTNNDSPASQELRSRSKSRQRAESNKAREFRDKRKKKDVKLGKITSISSSGNGSFPRSKDGKPGGKR